MDDDFQPEFSLSKLSQGGINYLVIQQGRERREKGYEFSESKKEYYDACIHIYDMQGSSISKNYEIEDEETGERIEVWADAEFSEEGNLQYVYHGHVMEEITKEGEVVFEYY